MKTQAKTHSYFVQCRDQAEALTVLAACFDDGFKAIASKNLNCGGWIVEYWK